MYIFTGNTYFTGNSICWCVVYFDGIYVAGNKYFAVYILMGYMLLDSIFTGTNLYWEQIFCCVHFSGNKYLYWMGYMLLNWCRLFLNELPISPKMSIYFRFGWEMGTPRSKKAKVMPIFLVNSSLIIVLIKLLHILYEVPTCRAETKTSGLALLSPW
jgi:hypothetical protein